MACAVEQPDKRCAFSDAPSSSDQNDDAGVAGLVFGEVQKIVAVAGDQHELMFNPSPLPFAWR